MQVVLHSPGFPSVHDQRSVEVLLGGAARPLHVDDGDSTAQVGGPASPNQSAEVNRGTARSGQSWPWKGGEGSRTSETDTWGIPQRATCAGSRCVRIDNNEESVIRASSRQATTSSAHKFLDTPNIPCLRAWYCLCQEIERESQTCATRCDPTVPRGVSPSKTMSSRRQRIRVFPSPSMTGTVRGFGYTPAGGGEVQVQFHRSTMELRAK